MTDSISPSNDPSKYRPAADCCRLLGTGVKTRISVNTARVASPPTMCTWTTNDVSDTTGMMASVAWLVKSVNFIILALVVPSLYIFVFVRQQ